MSGFLGSYAHQIDDKGRLSLPAAFRRDVADRPLVLVHVHGEALTLYPEETWVGVEARLRDLLRLQPESRPYVLKVTANALEVAPDKQGRVLVPQRMLDAVGIQGTALIVGVLDRIEIWNPARFEAVVGGRDPGEDRFVGQIFG